MTKLFVTFLNISAITSRKYHSWFNGHTVHCSRHIFCNTANPTAYKIRHVR